MITRHPPPANTEQYNRGDNLIASRSSGQVAGGGEWRARRWRLVKMERNQMSPAPACISIPSVAGHWAVAVGSAGPSEHYHFTSCGAS